MTNQNTPLAQPMKIGNRIAKNRFLIQPMECCDGTPDGGFSELTYERYRKLLEGQAGVIVFESVTMQYESRARDLQVALKPHDEANIKEWKEFLKWAKEINPDSIIIVQLNHSGEISIGGDQKKVTIKPLYGFGGEVVDEDYIEKTINEFVDASKILYDLGADGVDLKLCHGYLGSQILRPYNDRDWKYGGPWEKRRQFAYDLIERVRKAVNYDDNFLIGSKLSVWEGFPGGQGTAGPDTPVMDLTEQFDLLHGLKERGASFIIESNGAPLITPGPYKPNRNRPDDAYMHFTLAKALKDEIGDDLCIIGGGYSVLNNGKNKLAAVDPSINSLLHWGNYNIEHGYADMIALGRQSFADPYLPKKYIEGNEDEINWCTACDLCNELIRNQQNVGCVVHNPHYTKVLQELRKKKESE